MANVTKHSGMKTTFLTKYIRSKYARIFIVNILIFVLYKKYISISTQKTKLSLCATPILICIFVYYKMIKSPR